MAEIKELGARYKAPSFYAMADEVREVYAKAKAYDQIKVIHDKCIYDFLKMSDIECIEKIGDILEDKQ
ncbi:hypothetical protein MHH94_10110 [Mammaliicoccus sp. FSL K6-3158]|uniref:hypothetical protein n=1 Tax=Mammaliicoccus sp. FSL K6-3158 TaxID=2921491 RepID=UPI0030F6224E